MRPVIVQQSFPEPRPTTNPYVVQLLAALRTEPAVEVRTFSWPRAILRRYDVFHAHWPEILVSGRGRARTAARQLLFVLLMVRLGLLRTAIVRTAHNLELPSGLSRTQTLLLRWFDRATTHRIVLNRTTSLPERQRSTVVLHGDYRDWFSRFPRPAAIPGRIAYFGLIRRYKNVEALAAAFVQTDGASSLVIAGKPSSDDLRDAIVRAIGDDPRVSTRFEFLTEEALALVASEAQLVVLPYRVMHNSGGVLAALSLDRPVLVPGNAANDDLAREVGEDWVLRYDGELSAAAIAAALQRAARIPAGVRPDLSARSWDLAGALHVDAYSRALHGR